ncbi:MAG: M48 family metallopeptidase [Rhodobacteraceae bacterium]|nr:M48 family metallopeptidase [Paracoccaceae bacterium]
MLRYSPILLAVLIGWLTYLFSARKTRRDLAANSSELKDKKLLGLLRQMARALDIPAVRVYVYEIAPINGLASPDGKIFITRGLLDKYRSGEISAAELASVIAHEMGHIALGHSSRRLIDFTGQNVMRAMLMGVFGRYLPIVGGYLANFLITLLAASLSRKDEYEADAYGAALLLKSGIGLSAQIGMFRKLQIWSAKQGGTPAWLMSHPDTKLRIAAIEKLKAGWEV